MYIEHIKDVRDGQSFAYHILFRFYTDMHTLEGDGNHYRPNPGPFDPHRHIHSMQIFLAECDRFYEAWKLFEDEASRSLFIDLLRFHLAGHMHVRLPVNTKQHWEMLQRAADLPRAPGQVTSDGMYGPPMHYEFDYEGTPFKLDGYEGGVAWPFFLRQYFFERNGVRVRPEKGEHVVDGGACMGETCLSLGHAAGPDGWVYGFDPLPIHKQVCEINFKQNRGLTNFKFFMKGLSDRVFDPPRAFATADYIAPAFRLESDNQSIPTTTIDHLVANGEIERVDFIKMDIEGSELAALRGAEQSLRRYKPKLAVSIYHDLRHFFEVPQFLASLNLGYRFYLDHYTIYSAESVLYAIARQDS